jgi:hypothetical protein
MTLAELKDDWPSVKRKASKLGKKLLTKMPKSRFGIDPDKTIGTEEKHRSKNGNMWHISAYCNEGSKIFWTVTYVEVERENGLKSYIYLRGMRTPHQYYVEIVPHAIRRLRERYINIEQTLFFADREVREILDHAVFNRHECGVFLRSGRYFRGKFIPYIDEDGNTHGKLLTKNCLFGARITPLGNFILRTFLNLEAPKGSLREKYYMMFACFYKTRNDQEYIDDRKKAAELTVSLGYNLGMMDLVQGFAERLVPLYP